MTQLQPSQMKNNRQKPLDYTYLLLVPFLAIGIIPYLKYRIPFKFIWPLPLFWFLMNIASLRPQYLSFKTYTYYLKSCCLIAFTTAMPYLWPLLQSDFRLISSATVVDITLQLLFISILYCALNNGKIKELKLIVCVCLLSIVIGGLISLRGLSSFSEAARTLTAATSETIDVLDIGEALRLGVGRYDSIYGLGLLIFPIVMVSQKCAFRVKLLLCASACLFGVIVIRAGFSILVLAMAVGFGGFLLQMMSVKNKIYKGLIGITLCVITIITLAPQVLGFLAPLLDALENVTENESYLYRIHSLQNIIAGNEGYARYRTELYWNSWQVFTQAPILGYEAGVEAVKGYIPGGHSFFFDTLGRYGVIGSGIVFAMYWDILKFLRGITRECGFVFLPRCLQVYFTSYLFVALFNPVGGYQIQIGFMLLLPGLGVFAMKQQHISMSHRRA